MDSASLLSDYKRYPRPFKEEGSFFTTMALLAQQLETSVLIDLIHP